MEGVASPGAAPATPAEGPVLTTVPAVAEIQRQRLRGMLRQKQDGSEWNSWSGPLQFRKTPLKRWQGCAYARDAAAGRQFTTSFPGFTNHALTGQRAARTEAHASAVPLAPRTRCGGMAGHWQQRARVKALRQQPCLAPRWRRQRLRLRGAQAGGAQRRRAGKVTTRGVSGAGGAGGAKGGLGSALRRLRGRGPLQCGQGGRRGHAGWHRRT